MRWVDIDQLEIPYEWQVRANKALDDLRQEICNAEQVAKTNGEDIANARKKAISQGVNNKSRQQIWRDLAPFLAKLHKQPKCWYSESFNSGSDKNVDHFRPKARVDEDPNHEGYWWLAFDWRNYRYSCQWSNQRRVNSGTNGGKSDHFPISGTFRASQETDELKMEDIDLLDPIDPDDCKLLTFLPNGQPTPAHPTGTKEYRRAETSIRIYHLDYREFVVGRRNLATTIRLKIEEMDTCYSRITDINMREIFKNRQKEILRLIDRNSEYSAAALAYAREQVFKMERGHQVKRQWLEDILNSNS
jgi:uncharacterized protein (TIGR02646 family)